MIRRVLELFSDVLSSVGWSSCSKSYRHAVESGGEESKCYILSKIGVRTEHNNYNPLILNAKLKVATLHLLFC
jgi:hypothetical protein